MPDRPKVLHVWNPGRVPAILARAYPESLVLLSGKELDPFQTGEDPNVVYAGSMEKLSAQVLEFAPLFDVVHVHSLDWLVPCIRREHPGARIILHHHGQNLREQSPELTVKFSAKADAVLVSTPDLLKLAGPRAEWLPNPIDEQLFKPSSYEGHGDLFPVCYERELPFVKEVQAALPNVTLWYRWKDPVPYWEMPSFLSSYARLIAWKPEVDYSATTERVLALTDLECLMLGKQVYYWPGKETLTGFPARHRTENVLEQLDEIYARVLA